MLDSIHPPVVVDVSDLDVRRTTVNASSLDYLAHPTVAVDLLAKIMAREEENPKAIRGILLSTKLVLPTSLTSHRPRLFLTPRQILHSRRPLVANLSRVPKYSSH